MARAKVTCSMTPNTRVRLSNIVLSDNELAIACDRMRRSREGVEVSAPASGEVEIGHRGLLLRLLEQPTVLTVDSPQDVVDEGWASAAEVQALGYDVS